MTPSPEDFRAGSETPAGAGPESGVADGHPQAPVTARDAACDPRGGVPGTQGRAGGAEPPAASSAPGPAPAGAEGGKAGPPLAPSRIPPRGVARGGAAGPGVRPGPAQAPAPGGRPGLPGAGKGPAGGEPEPSSSLPAGREPAGAERLRPAAAPAGQVPLRGKAFRDAVRAEEAKQARARRNARSRYPAKRLGGAYGPGMNRRPPPGAS